MPKKPLAPSSTENPARDLPPGRSLADVLALPDPLRQLATWIIRQAEVCLAEVVAHTGYDEDAVRTMLETLREQGFVHETSVAGESRYRTHFVSKSRRQSSPDRWKMLDEKLRE